MPTPRIVYLLAPDPNGGTFPVPLNPQTDGVTLNAVWLQASNTSDTAVGFYRDTSNQLVLADSAGDITLSDLILRRPNSLRVYSGAGLPLNTFGIDGDMAYNRTTKTFYTKSNGAWDLNSAVVAQGQPGQKGDPGDPGNPGADGAAGSIIYTLNSSGPPSPSIGRSIDVALDADGVWYAKSNGSNGAWPTTGILLKGEQGPPGSVGGGGGDGSSVWHFVDMQGAGGPPDDSIGDGNDLVVNEEGFVWVRDQGVNGSWPVDPQINLRGATGATGPAGSKWLKGSGAPSSSIGSDGDMYIASTTGIIYGPKAGGAWSGSSTVATKGAAGTNGTNGTNGLGWINGTVAPDNATGVDGSLYINTTTNAYYVKAAGSWGSPISLQGPRGDPGASGISTISLTGDVTGSGSNGSAITTVAFVGGATAFNVAQATTVVAGAKPANTFLGGLVSGGTNTPSFRALVDADIPIHALSKLAQTSATNGQAIVWNGTTWAPATISSTNGTVTSVGLTASSLFTVGNSPVTSAGNITLAMASQSANAVLCGPATGSASPTFRALVDADIPVHALNKLAQTSATNGQVIAWNGTAWAPATVSAGGSGTVTSVALSLPSILQVTGSPVTTSGTLTAALAVQTANTILCGPTNGGGASPAFRTLVVADIPTNLPLTLLAQGGATAAQVLTWSGSAWTPAAAGGGALGPVTPVLVGTGTVTLALTDSGNTVLFNGAATGGVATLPAGSTTQATKYTFVQTNANADMTIQCPASNYIIFDGITGTVAGTLKANKLGLSCQLVNPPNSNVWYMVQQNTLASGVWTLS